MVEASDPYFDLTLNLSMKPIPTPHHELHYRALGLVKGILQPLPNAYAQGTLITDDGSEYPATPGRIQLLRRFTHCMESQRPYWFYAHPQPRAGQTLGLSVIRILAIPTDDPEASEGDEEFPLAPDDIEEGFNIRGNVQVANGSIEVTVKRKPLGGKQFPPLILNLEGFLPGVEDGEFWDLLADREGHELLLVDGTRLLPAA